MKQRWVGNTENMNGIKSMNDYFISACQYLIGKYNFCTAVPYHLSKVIQQRTSIETKKKLRKGNFKSFTRTCHFHNLFLIHVDSDSRELASEYVHIDFRKILQFSSQQMNFVFSQKFYKNLGKATITKEVTKKLHSRNIFWWKHSVEISGLLCHSVFMWNQVLKMQFCYFWGSEFG